MPSMFAYSAPLALLLPLLGQELPRDEGQTVLMHSDEAGVPDLVMGASAPDHEQPTPLPFSSGQPVANPLDAFHSSQTAYQVRIEQRVIVRISPQRTTNRNSLLARLPQRGLTTRYEEREMDDSCLPVNRISGVQTGNGNRLLLFLSDRQIVSVNLERACRAREFYSGFYVERNEDGQICVGRDKLQSRSGAQCEVERMSQLVAVTE